MDYQDIDKIITLCVSEEEARQKLAVELAKCDKVPVDVFDNLDIKIAKEYYPLWVFKGSFKAPWSCLKVVRNKNFNVYETNIPRTVDYFPVNGVAVGNFEFAISATMKSNIFLQTGVAGGREYTPSKVEKEATLYSLDYSSEETWSDEKSQKYVDRVVFDKIQWQLPNEYEEMNYYMDYSYKSYNVLYGILNMEYQYKGKTYLCKMDAYGNILSFNHPSEKVNLQIDKDVLKVDVLPPTKIEKFGWSCVGLVVIGLIFLFVILIKEKELSKEAVFGGILIATLITMPVVYLIKISDIQDHESEQKERIDKLWDKIKKMYKQRQHSDRMQKICLSPCTLLEPYRGKLKKFSEPSVELSRCISKWEKDVKKYNTLVRHDKFLILKYCIILFSLVSFVTFYLIAF